MLELEPAIKALVLYLNEKTHVPDNVAFTADTKIQLTFGDMRRLVYEFACEQEYADRYRSLLD